MTSRCSSLVPRVLAGLLLVGLAAGAQTLGGFIEESLVYDGGPYVGEEFRYRLLVPEKLEDGERYPLLLFLHGAGERGDDNRAQLRHLPELFARPEYRERLEGFVLAPQCRQRRKWVDLPWDATRSLEMPAEPTHQMKVAILALQRTLREHPVDPDRVYLSGLSMGGYGCWDLAARHPEWFAAVAPICGGGDTKQVGRLRELPIWAWHGDADRAVPVDRSREMIAALVGAGGQPRYTELPGVGHASWSAAYRLDGVLPWLWKHRRGQDPPGEADAPALPFSTDAASRAARRLFFDGAGREALAGAGTRLRPGMSVSFFGDSITWQDVYISRIREALAECPATKGLGIGLHNRGINGGGVRDLRDGFPRHARRGQKDDAPQAPFVAVLKADQPTVAVVFIGINDVNWKGTSDGEFEAALRDLATTAERQGVRLVLATPTVDGERPDGSNEDDARIEALAAITRRVAADCGATLCDLRRVFIAWLRNHNAEIRPDGTLHSQDQGLLTYDRIHPTARGNELLAEHIALAIHRALE